MMRLNCSFLLIILNVLYCLHRSASFPTQNEESPCDLFYFEDDTDVTLFCDQKNTTLKQIEKALTDLKGQGTIEVELYQVDLGTIPSSFFDGHNVKILTIAFCELDSLSGGGGKPLQGLEDTLEVLMIKGSLMNGRELEISSFSHLRKLREITLHSNNFKEIGNNLFKNAPQSLRTIILSENGIEKLDDRVFADVLNLEYLFMDGNRFESIKRSMFPDLSKLYRLELESNSLTNIPEDMFASMPNLKMVSLAGNRITRVPENVWRPVWSQLTHIDLSENPLKCDNHMDWMSKKPTCTKVSATCESPSHLYGKRIPQTVSETCQ